MDLLDGLAAQGFRRIAIGVSGGNIPVTGFIREWLSQPRPHRVQVLYHSWCYGPQVTAAADRFDREQMHANWGENFPWNRLPGVDLPAGRRAAVPLEVITQLDARRIRAALPDGMMGGAYARPDEDMMVIWDAGVAEVRELLEAGWAA